MYLLNPLRRTLQSSDWVPGHELKLPLYGFIVQLVRTPACHAGGQGFKSPWSRHKTHTATLFIAMMNTIKRIFGEYKVLLIFVSCLYQSNSVGLEGLLHTQKVGSSNLSTPANKKHRSGAFLILKYAGTGVTGCDPIRSEDRNKRRTV